MWLAERRFHDDHTRPLLEEQGMLRWYCAMSAPLRLFTSSLVYRPVAAFAVILSPAPHILSPPAPHTKQWPALLSR